MTTTHVRSVDMEERWFLYDASEHRLGRMAAKIATQLMGKDRPTYTPSEAGGTHVVVINGAAPMLTGKKAEQKIYRHYTGYPNGQREVSLAKVAEKRPEDIVTLAVRRMLPKNRLGRNLLRRLKVYVGTDHPHSAQQPDRVEA
ncbi:MAG: 50S ribosomal protein L13 [Planctomycetota bacterium]|nr:50S ribosomal protein L13 [Planctomycetota bacterium]